MLQFSGEDQSTIIRHLSAWRDLGTRSIGLTCTIDWMGSPNGPTQWSHPMVPPVARPWLLTGCNPWPPGCVQKLRGAFSLMTVSCKTTCWTQYGIQRVIQNECSRQILGLGVPAETQASSPDRLGTGTWATWFAGYGSLVFPAPSCPESRCRGQSWYWLSWARVHHWVLLCWGIPYSLD